jgi:predicted metal-dependent enzyme (double-stranded beta helix superfamily)
VNAETYKKQLMREYEQLGLFMAFDVDEFISDCRMAMREDTPQLAVRDVVARAVSHPSAVERAFGRADGWSITKLVNDDEITILHFVWPPGLELFPHEHKMWSTVGIYGGIEDNTLYRRVENHVEVSGHSQGRTGDVLLLGKDGIHSVENRTRQWTAAVHVYGGDFFANPRLQWDKETGEPGPFDIANAKHELAAAERRGRSSGLIE